MGLDGVEIIMAVEEAFDIQIEDAEAAKVLTPRQLIELIQSKVAITAGTVCLTQRAFNLFRKSLLQQSRWKRSEITPATNLTMLFSREQRKLHLEKITADLAVKKPPALVRPKWVNIAVLAGALLIGLWGALAARQILSSVIIWVFMLVALLAGGIGLRLTKPLCKEFPAGLQTAGDLARWIMTHKADLALAGVPGWTRAQIAVRVREIIVEVLGCQPDFSEEANFVKDLGLG